MSSQISVEFRDSYLYIELPPEFEITPKNVENFWSVIGEACKKYDCKRVLAEGTISSRQMTSTDAYEAGKKAGDVAPLRLACLFYDYSPDETTHFFKMVALNRGVLVEYFTDRAKAFELLDVNAHE